MSGMRMPDIRMPWLQFGDMAQDSRTSTIVPPGIEIWAAGAQVDRGQGPAEDPFGIFRPGVDAAI
jgi:hypothetical protein